MGAVRKLQAEAVNLVKEEKLVLIGKIGYSARGAVYALLGILAVMLSLGEGGGLTDTHGLFLRMKNLPFGQGILLLTAFGLFSYAVWRFTQAIRDYENRGKSFQGIVVRIGYVLSGLTYFALAYYAVNLVFQLSRQSKQSGETALAETLLNQSFGAIITGLVAFIFIGVGIGQIYLALTEKFTRGLALPRSSRWLCRICKFGITARGIVFCIVGWLFMRAALTSNSREAAGLSGVWKFLSEQPYGSFLILAMAFGLLAFSVYGFTEAVYRRSIR